MLTRTRALRKAQTTWPRKLARRVRSSRRAGHSMISRISLRISRIPTEHTRCNERARLSLSLSSRRQATRLLKQEKREERKKRGKNGKRPVERCLKSRGKSFHARSSSLARSFAHGRESTVAALTFSARDEIFMRLTVRRHRCFLLRLMSQRDNSRDRGEACFTRARECVPLSLFYSNQRGLCDSCFIGTRGSCVLYVR